jgi:hypothetical protein
MELRINGTALELYPNTQLSFKWVNPFFSEEVQSGSYSFPINVPATTVNRLALSAPERIDGAGNVLSLTHSFEIYIKGVLFIKGTAKVLSPITKNGYRLFFAISTFTDKIGTTPLRDCDYGGERNMGDQNYGGWRAQFLDRANNTVLDDFVYGTSAVLPVDTLDFVANREKLINYVDLSTVTLPAVRYFSVYPRVPYVIRQIMAKAGYEFNAAVFDEAEYKDLILWSPVIKTWDCDSLFDAFDNTINIADYLPNMKATTFINAIRRAFGITFYFDRAKATVVAKKNSAVLTSTTAVNWSSLSTGEYELYQDSAPDGYTISYTNFDQLQRDRYLQKMLNLFLRNYEEVLDDYTTDIITPFFLLLWSQPGVSVIYYNDDYFRTNHLHGPLSLPNGQIVMPGEGDYFYFLQTTFSPVPTPDPDKGWRLDDNGYWYITEEGFVQSYASELPVNSLVWTPLKAQYQGVVDSTSELPSPDFAQLCHIYFVTDERQYYVCAYHYHVLGNPAAWRPLCGPAMGNDFVVGNGAKQISIPVATLPMAMAYNADDDLQVRVPFAQIDLIEVAERTTDDDFPPVILFYRDPNDQFVGDGMSSPPAYSYPYISSDDYAYYNEGRVGNLSLELAGENGAYTNIWQKWLTLYPGGGKKVTMQFNLKFTDLLNFNFWQKVRVGNQNYLVNTLEFSISNDQVSTVKAEMYKL